MSYEMIQTALTNTINIVVIAGITGIIAHALYNWHMNQIPTAPKANPDYQPSQLVTEILETLRAEGEQISECIESLELDGLQGEYGVEIVAEAEAETTPEPQINLNSLDAVTLRKLCTQHQIAWRNFKGANRHMPKATMIFNLQQRLTA